jgi:hypothetical protein
MEIRSRAAATTALLLAASVGGLAASSSTAQATHAPPADRGAHSLTVTIKTTKQAPKLSQHSFRPGKTTFKVVRGNSGGLIQVLRLRKGYGLAHAFKDFAKAFPDNAPPDVKAVRRIDKNVVFYGGMGTPRKGEPASRWSVNIDKAGKYFVVNLDKNNLATFRAKGKHQKRSMPRADGRLNVAPGNIWKPGKHNAHKGWMNTTNNALEPHFVDMEHVKNGTTTQDVLAFFQGGPNVLANDHAAADTGVISPGHTFRWHYHLPKGTYFAACFWPSKADGTPHAFMGMVKVFDLH